MEVPGASEGATADPAPAVSSRPAEIEARAQALLAHARALVGVRLADIADGLGLPVPAGRVRTKGWSGQIIERELAAGIEAENQPGESGRSGPDFAALGIELKTVPVDAGRRPLESTAVCVIDPVAIAGESWESSYVRRKLARVLFVALAVPEPTGSRRSGSVGDREVTAVRLWSASPPEEMRLRADFDLIVREYFRRGRGHELTGHVGDVLQVRPKARDRNDVRSSYDPEGRRVRVGRCGFYLRPAFVGAILRDG